MNSIPSTCSDSRRSRFLCLWPTVLFSIPRFLPDNFSFFFLFLSFRRMSPMSAPATCFSLVLFFFPFATPCCCCCCLTHLQSQPRGGQILYQDWMLIVIDWDSNPVPLATHFHFFFSSSSSFSLALARKLCCILYDYNTASWKLRWMCGISSWIIPDRSSSSFSIQVRVWRAQSEAADPWSISSMVQISSTHTLRCCAV